ncbi:hypothetical protein HanIR_Chr13g0657171 [Helianthus annuus]|nr:hypothetical protein HanIR_Chr13g0657171 [Helianthus annuus]
MRIFKSEGTYMARWNMFPAKKVKQEGSETVHHTFWCYPSYTFEKKKNNYEIYTKKI